MKIFPFIVLLLFSFFSKGEEITQVHYPLKICPAEIDRQWNISEVKKLKDIRVFCHKSMVNVLTNFVSDNTPCILEDNYLLCRDNLKRVAKLCPGISNVSDWTVHSVEDAKCVRSAAHSLKTSIPEHFSCRVSYQGILCIPPDFAPELVFDDFKGHKFSSERNIDCPKEAIDALGDINKVFCFFKEEMPLCEFPKLKAKLRGQDVCIELKTLFINVWNFDLKKKEL